MAAKITSTVDIATLDEPNPTSAFAKLNFTTIRSGCLAKIL